MNSSNKETKNKRVSLDFGVNKGGMVRFPVINFPGKRVRLDGEKSHVLFSNSWLKRPLCVSGIGILLLHLLA